MGSDALDDAVAPHYALAIKCGFKQDTGGVQPVSRCDVRRTAATFEAVDLDAQYALVGFASRSA